MAKCILSFNAKKELIEAYRHYPINYDTAYKPKGKHYWYLNCLKKIIYS